ncbi:cytochrome P450 [Peristeroidobacter soli]|uniref:cytochrome P450 n=1 Tax=Peristeroidobacter soli TaxID=2497877 RepID=UPI00101C0DC4|nr:cytochrome P450 [Peristeroidobacter soli]
MTAPDLNIDPFSDPVLRDPYPFFEQLRELAPVVTLPTYGCYAVGRYKEAFELVSHPERFVSSYGMGMSNIQEPGAWRTASPISEIDPPVHTRVRKALAKILSPSVIRQWQHAFEQEAGQVVDRAVELGTVDGIKDICERFVLSVFPRVLGVDVSPELFIAIGDMNFNQLGPNNERTQASVANAQPYLARYEQSFQRASMIPGGFGQQIFEAEDAGELLPGTATAHVRSFLRGGVDTTISGIGFALNQLARNSLQWDLLRAEPNRSRNAFDEAIRHESPAQVLFRTTLEETELGGIRLRARTKVAYFVGAANRDPRKWLDPDIYDMTRRGLSSQLAFGGGPHMCIGQLIAKLEADSVLGALTRKVARMEPAGEPEYRLVNTLRTLDRLPLRLHAA